MKKAIKTLLWIFVGFIALVLVAILTLPFWISPIATCVANRVVPFVTGTDFKMESFSLNPYTGKLRINGINLSNPKGFDEATALSVHQVRVDLDMGSLLTDVIHVEDITIEEPFVSYVFDGNGTNNFEQILGNVQSTFAASKANAPEKEEEKPAQESSGLIPSTDDLGIRFIIDRIAINGTWVKYRMIKIPVPVPTLRDIGGGKEGKGATPDEIKIVVWDSVKDKFVGVGGALGTAAGMLGNGVTDGASATVNAVGEGTTATVNAVGDGAKATVNAVGDGAKAVTEGAKDAFKKVGNLFGK